jgi:hypothetical protein
MASIAETSMTASRMMSRMVIGMGARQAPVVVAPRRGRAGVWIVAHGQLAMALVVAV